jgi:hypothetical protein
MADLAGGFAGDGDLRGGNALDDGTHGPKKPQLPAFKRQKISKAKSQYLDFEHSW